jgi:dTDP-4-dehydrorhamnose reductase
MAVEPNLLVNAAAYTPVNTTESESKLVIRINSELVGELSRIVSVLDIPMFHFSKDHVFDGCKNSPYVEADTPNPLNRYEESKLARKEAIKSSRCRHVIIRVSWFFPRIGKFCQNNYGSGGKKQKLEVVDDQFGVPIKAELISDVTAKLAGKLVSEGSSAFNLSVTYHFTSSGCTYQLVWVGPITC